MCVFLDMQHFVLDTQNPNYAEYLCLKKINQILHLSL